MNNKHCPDCKSPLTHSQIQCYCGWFYKQTLKQNTDRRCQYRIQDRQCPLIGTISTKLYGGGTWYCGPHWESLNNPDLCLKILLDAEKNTQN